MSTIASYLPLNISETIRDRGLVPKDHHQVEMANGESNGHATDDVTWPWKVKLDPNTLRPQYLENSWSCHLATIAYYYSLLFGSTVSYASDSLASCLNVDLTV